MKNLLTVVMLFVFSTALYAQKDVTKFLKSDRSHVVL